MSPEFRVARERMPYLVVAVLVRSYLMGTLSEEALWEEVERKMQAPIGKEELQFILTKVKETFYPNTQDMERFGGTIVRDAFLSIGLSRALSDDDSLDEERWARTVRLWLEGPEEPVELRDLLDTINKL